jgi:hypothetical protein
MLLVSRAPVENVPAYRDAVADDFNRELGRPRRRVAFSFCYLSGAGAAPAETHPHPTGS